MRVIAKRMLREFWGKVPASRGALEDWHNRAEHARWLRPQDVKATFGRADPMLINGRHVVVINIMGIRYRLITTVAYATVSTMGVIYTREVLAHAEYDTNQWKRRIA